MGEPVAVLFPDLAEPYRKIFTEIVSGIHEQAPQSVRAWPLAAEQNLPELALALRRNGTRVVIALGRQGLKAATAVEAPVGVVVGGVSVVPDGERQFGISLTPDPALLFAQLKKAVAGRAPRHRRLQSGIQRMAAASGTRGCP